MSETQANLRRATGELTEQHLSFRRNSAPNTHFAPEARVRAVEAIEAGLGATASAGQVELLAVNEPTIERGE